MLHAGRRQCRSHLHSLKTHFSDTLTQVRQSLAAPKLINQGGDGSASLSELLTSLVLATVEKVKSILQDLLVGFHLHVLCRLVPESTTAVYVMLQM